MNCLTDAIQEIPNDDRKFSQRDGLTVQITCRWDLALRGDLWSDDHAFDRPHHPDPLGWRAACSGGFGLHPEFHGLGEIYQA